MNHRFIKQYSSVCMFFSSVASSIIGSMITVLKFNSIIEMVVFYAIFFALLAIPAIYFYKKALKTRKTYKCKICGETYKTEHMVSTCCKACGGDVEEVETINE